MPAECPNCRQKVPFKRTFFTTAWGRWTCPGCGSLLGINMKRRIGVAIFGAAFPFAISKLLSMYGLSTIYLLPLVVVAFSLGLYFLDSAVVHERRGFHCLKCGYDLRGQRQPRCPECGTALDPTQVARMKPSDTSDDAHEPVRFRHRGGLIALVLIFVLTISVVVGTMVLRRTRAARTGGRTETRLILQSLLDYAPAHKDRMPRHAIELAADASLSAESFVSFDSLTMPGAVPLADVTLADFAGLSAERKNAIAQAAAAALPEGTIAHRLGDFVFTYHGIDLATADPDLWLLIWHPDPQQNPPFQPQDRIVIGLAGGKVIAPPVEEFPKLLSAQNNLRAAHTLPPLTNPFAVTHKDPM